MEKVAVSIVVKTSVRARVCVSQSMSRSWLFSLGSAAAAAFTFAARGVGRALVRVVRATRVRVVDGRMVGCVLLSLLSLLPLSSLLSLLLLGIKPDGSEHNDHGRGHGFYVCCESVWIHLGRGHGKDEAERARVCSCLSFFSAGA